MSFVLSYRNNKDLVCTKCKEDQSIESDTSVLTPDQVIKRIFSVCLSNMLKFTFCMKAVKNRVKGIVTHVWKVVIISPIVHFAVFQ